MTMLTESNIYADALLDPTPPRQQEVIISPAYLRDYLVILMLPSIILGISLPPPHVLAQQMVPPPPVPMAQQIAPLYPPDVHDDDTCFVLQIKVINIDGTKAGLTRDRGFRRFVVRHCSEFGLSGLVWRIPRVHGKILARGTKAQLDKLMNFMADLRSNGFVENYVTEKRQDFGITSNVFSVMPSIRSRVLSGTYSDKDLDDVVSTGSGDIPVLNSPVPQH
jgi:acylphosphatase